MMHYTPIRKKIGGFTLIELMMVISIVALLSSIVLASLASAKEKARVTRAKLDILTIANAVEAARSATGGKYLKNITGSQWTSGGSQAVSLVQLPIALNNIAVAGGNIYPGLKTIIYDPGKMVYTLDENEGENVGGNLCVRDVISAPGLKIPLSYRFEFSTEACKKNAPVPAAGFSY